MKLSSSRRADWQLRAVALLLCIMLSPVLPGSCTGYQEYFAEIQGSDFKVLIEFGPEIYQEGRGPCFLCLEVLFLQYLGVRETCLLFPICPHTVLTVVLTVALRHKQSFWNVHVFLWCSCSTFHDNTKYISWAVCMVQLFLIWSSLRSHKVGGLASKSKVAPASWS